MATFRSGWLREGEISLYEAARLIGCTYKKVRALIRRKQLPGYRRRHASTKYPGRRVTHQYVRVADVVQYLARPATPPLIP
jgi:hypothetical protein